MPYTVMENLNIENARIIFRNFSGKEGKFNRAGDRNFCVVIDDSSYAQKLLDDGWNVRLRTPREDGDDPFYYIPVAVSFDHHPPKVVMVTRKAQVPLNAESIGNLDTAEIRKVDLTLRPYNWEVNGNTGVKAYLKTMYITIEEDVFESKYDGSMVSPDADIPF